MPGFRPGEADQGGEGSGWGWGLKGERRPVDRRARALARAAPPTSPPLLTPTVHGTSSPGTLSVASGMPLAPATVLPAASAAAAAAATSGGGDTSSISTPNTGRPSACAPATRRRRTDAPGRRTRNACDAWTRPGEETRSWARGRPPLDSICGDGCVCVWRGGSSRWLRDRQSDFERSAPPPAPPAPPLSHCTSTPRGAPLPPTAGRPRRRAPR
jgi:hypothetical protein